MHSRRTGYFHCLLLAATLPLASCTEKNCLWSCGKQAAQQGLSVAEAPYGQMPDGRDVTRYTLSNKHGMRVQMINYGATTIAVDVPDRDGNVTDVTLGYDTLAGWLSNTSYFGATVGRYGNRIAAGRFTLDGQTYTLATNNDANHLHGGVRGFDKVLWDAETVECKNAVGVRFTYHSPDGEEGYPGNLLATALYTLNNKNEFAVEFTATTDKPTVINLVHHSYWNLGGASAGNILEHTLMLPADRYTPVDAGLIPTGELAPVAGTPMDFTAGSPIGGRIAEVDGGYDHNFVLRNQTGKVKLAARLHDPRSGRTMEIHSDQPGIQFYSGNFLDGSIVGKGGVTYQRNHGLCLETQHYPDSPNHPEFPSVVLRPGETYHHRMIHRFKAD